jgi:hypothetical protein
MGPVIVGVGTKVGETGNPGGVGSDIPKSCSRFVSRLCRLKG